MATAMGAAAPCTEKQRALVVVLAEDASPSHRCHCVPLGHVSLYLGRAAHRSIDDTRDFHQQAVAGSLPVSLPSEGTPARGRPNSVSSAGSPIRRIC